MIGMFMFVFYIVEIPPVNFKYPDVVFNEHRHQTLPRRALAMIWQAQPDGPVRDSLAMAFRASNLRLDSIRLVTKSQIGQSLATR